MLHVVKIFEWKRGMLQMRNEKFEMFRCEENCPWDVNKWMSMLCFLLLPVFDFQNLGGSRSTGQKNSCYPLSKWFTFDCSHTTCATKFLLCQTNVKLYSVPKLIKCRILIFWDWILYLIFLIIQLRTSSH